MTVQPLTGRCGPRHCRYLARGGPKARLVRLRRRQQIALGPADGYRLHVSTGRFARGDILYARVSSTRVIKR